MHIRSSDESLQERWQNLSERLGTEESVFRWTDSWKTRVGMSNTFYKDRGRLIWICSRFQPNLLPSKQLFLVQVVRTSGKGDKAKFETDSPVRLWTVNPPLWVPISTIWRLSISSYFSTFTWVRNVARSWKPLGIIEWCVKFRERSDKMYHFTQLAVQLNEEEEGVAPTDSRRRPDQRMMEEGKWVEKKRRKRKEERIV